MIEFTLLSTKLLLTGKLVRNYGYFYRQLGVGVILGLLLLLGLGITHINLAIAIAISSLVTGITMPFLLKDLKMQ
ncbi:MAG: hypothetical protein AB4041_10875 [Microcystaceae cyanobacterium]